MTQTDDLHALSGAYALNALDELERARFERHLGRCETCAAEVAEFLETSARLGAAEAEAPPPGLREAVLDEIAITRQDRPAVHSLPSVQLPSSGRWRERLAMPAAAVLAILVIGLSVVVNGLNDRLTAVEATATGVTDVVAAPDAEVIEIEAEGGAAGRVVHSPARGEAVFLVSGLAAAPAGHAYELWFLDGDSAPTPAGLFHADADGRAVHRITAELEGLTGLAVTVEVAAGSPVPTTDPVITVDL